MNSLFIANIWGPQGMMILVILLLLFGARRLPELAKGLGQAIREFSKAKNDISDEIMREPSIERPRPIETAQAPTIQTQAAPNTQPVSAPQPAQSTQPTNPQV